MAKNRAKIFVKNGDSDYCQKCEIFFRFFNRSLASHLDQSIFQIGAQRCQTQTVF